MACQVSHLSSYQVLLVTRQHISELLKSAAVAVGESATGISSHSLRGGGATALYSKGYTKEQIMYLGRWLSDSWMIYVKMTKECMGNIAHDLATAHYTVVGASSAAQQVVGNTRRQALSTGGTRYPKAWWDPMDDCTFVLIHTAYDKKHQHLVAHYLSLEDWEKVEHPRGAE